MRTLLQVLYEMAHDKDDQDDRHRGHHYGNSAAWRVTKFVIAIILLFLLVTSNFVVEWMGKAGSLVEGRIPKMTGRILQALALAMMLGIVVMLVNRDIL